MLFGHVNLILAKRSPVARKERLLTSVYILQPGTVADLRPLHGSRRNRASHADEC